ncbi:DUF2992 family protein [Staphylococcus aureus]
MELSIFLQWAIFCSIGRNIKWEINQNLSNTHLGMNLMISIWIYSSSTIMKISINNATIYYTKNISRKVNPKRLQRQIAKDKRNLNTLTQAQIAIKKELELKKKQKRKNYKEKRDAFQKRKREIKKVKAKEKHKGH